MQELSITNVFDDVVIYYFHNYWKVLSKIFDMSSTTITQIYYFYHIEIYYIVVLSACKTVIESDL